uniref:Cytochrome P450 n=1 Tax=Strigamia maritima TaxID=126957 RepID=T1IZ49_STRMM
MFVLILVGLLLVWMFVDKFYSKFRRYPPGPVNLPLVGALPFLGKKPFVKFAEWARIHGPVIRIRVGLKNVVVLNSYEAIVEAFVKKGKVFNHRNPVSLLRLEMKGLGLLNNEGDSWAVHRRFTTRCLKNLGFGKIAIETHLLDEISEMISDMQREKGGFFDPKNMLMLTVANMMWSTVAGQRFQRGDPKLLELAKMNDDVIKSIGTMGILSFYPQLRYVFHKKYETFKTAIDNLKEYLHQLIDHHHQMLTDKDKPSDLISEYLAAAEGKELSSEFTDQQICAVLLDLFVAGLETTVTVIRWAILLAVKHSHVQYKLMREIDQIIGHFRLPTNDDRLRMPYTEAFVAEVLRYSCVVPMVHHCTAHDTHLMDFFIPAGTPIIANLWSFHMDQRNDDSFDVDRFLDGENKLLKVEQFIPFGVGKRGCPGESVARMEIFLVLTSLLQKFIIKPGSELCTEPNIGLVLSPRNFSICLEQRRSLSES